MDAATIGAISAAVVAVLGAAGSLVAQWRHATGPAHNPPGGSGGSGQAGQV